MMNDVRYAIRSLAAHPGFAIAALATLALGIGANTAVFTIVNAVLFAPLPYPEPERIVQVLLQATEGENRTLTVPGFLRVRAQTGAFEEVAAFDAGGPGFNLTDGERPERVDGTRVSAGYFHVLGAEFSLGRTFTAEEDRPGGAAAVVISNSLWRRRFGADARIVGTRISIGGEPHTVAGVTAPDFVADPPADVWLPLRADPASTSRAHYLEVIARTRGSASPARVRSALASVSEDARRLFGYGPRTQFIARNLLDDHVGAVRPGLLMLWGAVALVLLIACANVSNLLLARAPQRRREVSIKTALGATRSRIIRQLLIESLVLSVLGGMLGFAMGHAGVRLLVAAGPPIPRLSETATLDWSAFALHAAISLAIGLLVGLAPAMTAARGDLISSMKPGLTRAGAGWLSSWMVVAQVALSIMLLVGAGLLIRSFAALRSVNLGFRSDNVVTAQMSLVGRRFEKTQAIAAMVAEAERRVTAISGVEAIGSSWMLPLESAFNSSFRIEGRPLPPGEAANAGALLRPVSEGYFSALHIPILRGRAFSARDTGQSAGVVVITQAMAQRFWPGADPIGEHIHLDSGNPDFTKWTEVIGVAGDVPDIGLRTAVLPLIYLPQSQVTDAMTALDTVVLPFTWIIRSRPGMADHWPQIEAALSAASGGLPVARIRPMSDVVRKASSRDQFQTLLLSAFAAVALMLSAIGLYGVISYGVERRTREIGIRLALGARARGVLAMIVSQGMGLVCIGGVTGIIGAWLLSRSLSALLFGVTPRDPLVFLSVPAVLAAVAFAAVLIPARRASRVNPIAALRHE